MRCRDGSVTTPTSSMQRPSTMSAVSHQHVHEHDCGHDHHHDEHTAGPIRADALLSGRGVSFARGGRTILEHIDIGIGAGEIVTLIGPNGAGKTTLVRVLLGLEKPDSGMIERRPDVKIGYVPQRFDRDPAIPVTVERFLSLGLPDPGADMAAALSEVGALHVAGQQLHGLSGGELQRVVLARALLRNSNLLVLDEPVRGVDYVGEAELYGLIGQLRTTRGLGVLLVSHDLHVVMAQSDRVICLNRHVCCSGVPETVSQHPEYARLFGAQAARAFAVYHHAHDHSHDLTGEARPKDLAQDKPT
jgi:zinc transport system ATP-binding protein